MFKLLIFFASINFCFSQIAKNSNYKSKTFIPPVIEVQTPTETGIVRTHPATSKDLQIIISLKNYKIKFKNEVIDFNVVEKLSQYLKKYNVNQFRIRVYVQYNNKTPINKVKKIIDILQLNNITNFYLIYE